MGFDRKSARNASLWASATRDTLRAIANKRSVYEQQIKGLYIELLKEKILKQMRDIPVEKLNERKEGIKVGLLRENGYRTVFDTFGRYYGEFTRINGIGEQNAIKIVENAERIYRDLAQTTTITLNDMDNSPKWQEILGHLNYLIKNRESAERAQMLLNKYGDVFDACINDSQPFNNFFSWTFSGKAKKEHALEAYDTLSSIREGSFMAEMSQIGDSALLDRGYADASLINSYKHDPVPFIAYWDKIFGENKTGLQSDMDEFAKKILALELNTAGLKAILRSYQVFGTKYIISQEKTLLGDEMGLGKTMQALAAMVHLANEGETHFLVFCPLSVVENWNREIHKFTNLETTIFYGNEGQCLNQWNDWLAHGGVGITNFETAKKIEPFKDTPVGLMVVDEAHYIKNPEALRTQAVTSMGLWAKKTVYMTGTPLENKVDEMRYLISCLQPEIAKKLINSNATVDAPTFRKLIMPVYLRRTRADVLKELPEKIEYQDWLIMNDTEKASYREALYSSENPFMKIRRVSYNVPDITKSTKAERLLQICDDARDDERKIIIFSFFKDTLNTVAALLGERCIGVLDGSVSAPERQGMIDTLAKSPAGSALVAQIVAGGVGLNIQEASVVIFCEPQIKPSLEDQAMSRAYRMGQLKTVMVHWLLCSRSVDEQIMSILTGKRQLFNEFADKSDVSQLDNIFTSDEINKIIEQEKENYSGV